MLFEPNFIVQVMEIYNFTQDDLMTEDIFILDCHSDIFVWVGQLVDTKSKLQALTIGEVRTTGCIGGCTRKTSKKCELTCSSWLVVVGSISI